MPYQYKTWDRRRFPGFSHPRHRPPAAGKTGDGRHVPRIPPSGFSSLQRSSLVWQSVRTPNVDCGEPGRRIAPNRDR